ncbi:RRM domain-containing protein [Mycena chlorophos]|uniref:RRM domain-containing protein n=1 Tax=Mycena chlorophos TaxID=658473 RepID=A0A8H6S8L1_MYCCL|nr:RRM domain-containing protein [Mycena chlorophos]
MVDGPSGGIKEVIGIKASPRPLLANMTMTVNKRGTYRAPSISSSNASASFTPNAAATPIPESFSFKKIGGGTVAGRKTVAAKTHDKRKTAAKVAATSTRGKIRRSELATVSRDPLMPLKTRWVFVGNLAPAVTELTLRRHFSSTAGPIRDVSIRYCGPPQKTEGAPPASYRYAIVVFSGTDQQASASTVRALDQNGAILAGDPQFCGFKIVVSEEPAGLPEVAEALRTVGLSQLEEEIALTGLPEQYIKKVPGVYTAIGHQPGNDERLPVVKTAVWDPSKLAAMQAHEAQRLEKRRERRDAYITNMPQLRPVALANQNQTQSVRTFAMDPPVKDSKGKGKAKVKTTGTKPKTICIGGQRFTFSSAH